MFEKFEEFEEFEEFECLKSSTFRVGGEESSATGITVIEEQPDIVEDMSALIEEFEEFEEFEGFECSAFSVLCSALWVEDYSWVRIPVVGEQPYIAEEKLTLIEDRFFFF